MSKVFKIGIAKNNNQEIQEVKEINLSVGKGIIGEMAEWSKAHAWKVCVPSQVPWVRIPLSPPLI